MGFRHRRVYLGAACVALALVTGTTAWSGGKGDARPRCPDPDSLVPDTLAAAVAHARYLASDAFEGRATGSREARCAAAYIAQRFEEWELRPGDADGDYYQTFRVRRGSRLSGENVVRVAGELFRPSDGWVPFAFSGSLEAEGRAVAGSASLTREAGGSGVDSTSSLAGKVVVLEPASVHSAGGGGHGGTGMSRRRARSVARKGGEALVVLRPDVETLDPFLRQTVHGAAEIPVLVASGRVAEALRSAVRDSQRVHVTTSLRPAYRTARNVVAQAGREGASTRKDVVVLGAHYDHLGRGEVGAMSRAAIGQVHNGADDNASGVAVLMEVARRMAGGEPPAQRVLFVAFTGEERGLLGSQYYVAHPPAPIADTRAMINLDMVGRMREGRLLVLGSGSAEGWDRVLRSANRTLGDTLALRFGGQRVGRSDHSAFYLERVPSVHLFTGLHGRYHRPSDDWNTLNARGMDRTADFVAAALRRLEDRDTLAYVAGLASGRHGRAADTARDEQGGYGPYFGTMPDFSYDGPGVRLAGVQEESPASEAGLASGDTLVRFAGDSIGTLYDYADALRAREPGDTVTVAVRRGSGRVVRVMAVLGRER